MDNFGHQCDAICANGKRCKCKNSVHIPTAAVYDARVTSYSVDRFRPVRLCFRHSAVGSRKRRANQRLKLHHGGWLGAFNRHQYGNLVINKPTVDWDNVKNLTIPKYWAARNSNEH